MSGRPFQPGNKFSRGRPKGSRNKSTLFALELLCEHSNEVVQECIKEALKGNKVALKLCMDRIVPARTAPRVQLALPPVNTASEVAQALNVVLKAITSGRLTPEEGRTISAILESKRRAIETDEQEARILALETNE